MRKKWVDLPRRFASLAALSTRSCWRRMRSRSSSAKTRRLICRLLSALRFPFGTIPVTYRQDQEVIAFPVFPSWRLQSPWNTQRTAWTSRSVSRSTPMEYRIPWGRLVIHTPDSYQLRVSPTLNGFNVSCPPCRSLRKAGVLFPRAKVSCGSRTLTVEESDELLTQHTSTLPKHTPALKKLVCPITFFGRLFARVVSFGSRPSTGTDIRVFSDNIRIIANSSSTSICSTLLTSITFFGTGVDPSFGFRSDI